MKSILCAALIFAPVIGAAQSVDGAPTVAAAPEATPADLVVDAAVCALDVAVEPASQMLALQLELARVARALQDEGKADEARGCAAKALAAGERGLAIATGAYVESIEAAADIAQAQGHLPVAIVANRKGLAALRLAYEGPQIPARAQSGNEGVTVYDSLFARLALRLAERLEQAGDANALPVRAGLAALAGCNVMLSSARADLEGARDALAQKRGESVPSDVPDCPGPAYFLVVTPEAVAP